MVYNDLNGEEIKSVLKQRFSAILDQVPFLQRHLTLPRVSMTMRVQLDQWADQPNPERLEIADSFVIENKISAAPTPDGHPPDQVRDEHGLPIPTPHHGDKKIGAHPFIFGMAVSSPFAMVSDNQGTRIVGGRISGDSGPHPVYTGGVPSPVNLAADLSVARPMASGGSTSEAAADAPILPALSAIGRIYGNGSPVPGSLEGRSVEEVPGLAIDRTGQGGLTSAGLAKMQGATVVNMDRGPAGLRQGGERSSLGIFKNARSR